MTDPSNSLESFQEALAQGIIRPKVAEIHKDILFLVDNVNNQQRFTYALKENEFVVGLASVIPVEPINGFPCLNIGYAIDKSYRSKGYGKKLVQKAFDELTNGFKRTEIPHLYIEAIIGANNKYSNKLANSVFTGSPKPCTDSISGEAAFQYVKQLY